MKSMNFASVIMTFIPRPTTFSPVIFKASVFFNEEELLGEAQPDKPRARLFMSSDGQTGQYIDNFAISGKRDLTIFDGIEADLLAKWAFNNPQPMFDFSFVYQRNDQDAADIRTQYHKDCKFLGHPVRTVSNDITVIKFNFQYAGLKVLNAAGQPL